MAPSRETSKYLRRYTDLPALIYLLKNKVLTLLNPETWDDKNDSTYLRLYKEKAGLSTLLALCFSESDETYHHWKVFAPGSCGVCITFQRVAIENAANAYSDVTLQKVRYLRIIENRKQPLRRIELLYSKRRAFADEREIRLLFRSKEESRPFFDLPISLSAIERVTLSPWLHPNLRDDICDTIRTIPDCCAIKIVRSTLVSNREWRKLGEGAI